MPVMYFAGVSMHELCLSVIITRTKHPLVFVSLVLSDIAENLFCLFCLAINAKPSTNKVAPVSSSETSEFDRVPLTRRRSSNSNVLVRDKSLWQNEGTVLFIASTLLQREVRVYFVLSFFLFSHTHTHTCMYIYL
jgi:hypothetical protein